MKIQIFISRFLFLTILFASLFGTALYAKPLTNDEKAKRKKEVVAMLSGTTWDVELFPMDDPKKKPIKDVVSFENGKLKSKAFAVEGYNDSNLTVTIEDDGKAIWETMQSHESKGPIFWRGELADKAVNGVLSRQTKEGATEAYSLRGVQSGTFEAAPIAPPVIIEAPKEVIPAAQPVIPAAAAVPAAPTALDALLGKKTMPETAKAAVTPTAVKTTVPTAASAVAKQAAPVVAVKPAVVAVPAKPAVAAVKAEVKSTVQQTSVKAAEPVKEEDTKEKKSKWSW